GYDRFGAAESARGPPAFDPELPFAHLDLTPRSGRSTFVLNGTAAKEDNSPWRMSIHMCDENGYATRSM
ncbi:MAG: hypothetical protein WAV72_12095, partial [Bradyrhizobium sp.]